jgi:hypothetical protein
MTGVLLAGVASAQDVEGELRDFVTNQLLSEPAARREEARRLIEANRQLQVNRSNRSELNRLETELRSFEAERDFLRKAESQLSAALGGAGGLSRFLENQKLSPEALKAAESCKGEGKICTKEVDIQNTPFTMIVKATPKDGAHTLSIEVKLKDGSAKDIRTPGNALYFRGAENLSDADLNRIWASAYGNGAREVVVDLSDKNDWAKVLSDGKLSGGEALGAQLFANPNAGARNQLRSRIEALGERSKASTEIGLKEMERKEAASPAAFNEKQREIRARQKVLEYLARNPNLKDQADPCDVMIKAVGWKDLPQTTKQECAEKNPEILAKKEDAEKQNEKAPEPKQDEEKAQIMAQMKAMQEHWQGLVQHCLGMVRNMNAQAEQKSIVDAIQPIYEQMLKQGFTSEFFAELIGQNALMQGMMDFTQDPGEMPDQARRIVDSTPKTKDGLDKLNRERESIARMLKISGGSLGMVAGASPMGLSDPALQGDPKVSQLIRYHSAATALLAAIDAQLDSRRQGERARIQSIDAGSGGGDLSAQSSGVPVVGGARSGSLAPASGGANVRPADRSKPRTPANRNSSGSGSRSGAPRNSNNPGFLN